MSETTDVRPIGDTVRKAEPAKIVEKCGRVVVRIVDVCGHPKREADEAMH